MVSSLSSPNFLPQPERAPVQDHLRDGKTTLLENLELHIINFNVSSQYFKADIVD
jgi:hypothetical protein